MRVLVFDPVFGAAGDMVLGALLHAGGDYEKTIAAMKSVASPQISNVTRQGVLATYVETKTEKTRRTLSEVLEIVRKADAPNDAILLAINVFERINAAEEKVHNSHHVHFHEVGADDAISDVLGSCTAFLSLKPDAVLVRPIETGSGTVVCAHGTVQVPAPATAEILANANLSVSLDQKFSGELLTPTGAALLAEFSMFGNISVPENIFGKYISVGYGAGTRDPKDHPNVLRVTLLETSQVNEGIVDLLETNVDDLSGEVLAFVMQKMMDEGARDVSLTPIIMKKGRAGHLIRVISLPKDSERLAKILAKETGSLGIRCIPMTHRFVSDRSIETGYVTINGETYASDVKTGYLDERPYTKKAEFDQIQRIAERSKVPVRDVKRAVEENAWKK